MTLDLPERCSPTDHQRAAANVTLGRGFRNGGSYPWPIAPVKRTRLCDERDPGSRLDRDNMRSGCATGQQQGFLGRGAGPPTRRES